MPHHSTILAAFVAALETAKPYAKAMSCGIFLPHGVPNVNNWLHTATKSTARPAKPTLLPHLRTAAGFAPRNALLHAIGHAELNTIALALRVACRFIDQAIPKGSYIGKLGVEDNEPRHFLMRNDRLTKLGAT